MPRKRLLVVDDERDMLDCVAEVLGEHFDLTLAHDAGEALVALQRSEFDAVLLDLKMPGADGFDVLSYLKKSHIHTRVLITSGLPSLDRIAARYGDVAWLAKPYRIEMLENSISRLLGDSPDPL